MYQLIVPYIPPRVSHSPDTVKVHVVRRWILPRRRHNGAEDTVIGVRQRAVFILDEVGEGRLRRFQHAQVS